MEYRLALDLLVHVLSKKLTRVGFEPTPGYPDEKPAGAGKLALESHALDRSAILPCLSPNSVGMCAENLIQALGSS